MNKKVYRGYQSFQYLQPGVDYKVFKLDTTTERNNSYHMSLTADEQARVESIFNENVIVSLRDHGFMMPLDRNEIIEYCRQPHTFFNYEGLSNSGLDVIFENFMDGIMLLTSKNGLKWDDIIYNLGIRLCDLAHQDTVYMVRNIEDIEKAKTLGRIALVGSLESAGILENELDRIDILYGFGIRCMGITYNEANTLGSGLSENKDAGLTAFGRKAIKRMNKLGMAIDISHCGERTSLDVIKCSETPVLITHVGARELWNTRRMFSDKVLKACAEKGGLIGIGAAPNTTLSKGFPNHSIESVMEHFAYIVDLVGIDHVGFGPDTFYGDHVALQHAFDDLLAISKSHSFSESPYVAGMENPSESMINVVKWLVRHGYSDYEIAKVVGGNSIRVMKHIFNN